MELKVYRSDSATAALVVGHGAGAGQNSPFMVRTAEGLAARGIAAATFDFPYMTARRSVPDRPPVLEQAWRDAIAQARTELGGLPLFIGGKSMGGRIASQVASQGVEGVSGLVFLGYPLHPPGKPEQRRDAHLPAIAQPMLFVQGTPRRRSARPTRSVRCCRPAARDAARNPQRRPFLQGVRPRGAEAGRGAERDTRRGEELDFREGLKSTSSSEARIPGEPDAIRSRRLATCLEQLEVAESGS